MRIYQSLTDLTGNTPLLEIHSLNTNTNTQILAKLEYYNPANSIKDRVSVAIIKAAEKAGQLQPKGTIVEATSGNTGIGLAWAGAALGYNVILTMPASMSVERQMLARGFGAQLVLTAPELGMQGALDKAQEIVTTTPNAILAAQFANEANPQIHYTQTGPEIWQDTAGKVDIFIAGVGTGGTISGVGKYLREQNPKVKIIAVEPAESPLLSQGKTGAHAIQGIGANFIPKTLDQNIYDEVITVSSPDAINMAQSIAHREGVLSGISGGAALYAAQQVASRTENAGKTLVTIVPDFGERYISTALFTNQAQ